MTDSVYKILFTGCSYTSGYGLDQERHHPDLWCNQIGCRLFPSAKIDNHARPGASNLQIFNTTVDNIRKVDYDLVIVAWTSYPRLDRPVGFERWDTNITGFDDCEIDLHQGLHLDKGFFAQLFRGMIMIHHDLWHIAEILRFSNVLQELTKTRRKSSRIFFVNGLCNWDENFFSRGSIQRPNELSLQWQNLLDVVNRDDDDIFYLYETAHQHLVDAGGIDERSWLNLYSSLRDMQVDNVSSSDGHPGLQSQKIFSDRLCNEILTRVACNVDHGVV